jgi:hypothetical protein
MKTAQQQGSSRMKHYIFATITMGSMLFLGHGVAGAAVPSPTGTRSASDTITDLEAKGHHVQINGSTSAPPSACKATGVHGLNDSNLDSAGNRIEQDQFSTVYVDVVCPNP